MAPSATCDLLGASWCGFTRKQQAALDGGMRDALRARGVDVTVTDCAAKDARCPQVDGYPTWRNATTGATMSGFTEDVDKLAAFCGAGGAPPPPSVAGGKQCDLLGASWCGFTRKQQAALDGGMRDALRARGVDVTVTDCAAKDARCPQVDGYPTWRNAATGAMMSGFTEDVDKLAAFCG